MQLPLLNSLDQTSYRDTSIIWRFVSGQHMSHEDDWPKDNPNLLNHAISKDKVNHEELVRQVKLRIQALWIFTELLIFFLFLNQVYFVFTFVIFVIPIIMRVWWGLVVLLCMFSLPQPDPSTGK